MHEKYLPYSIDSNDYPAEDPEGPGTDALPSHPDDDFRHLAQVRIVPVAEFAEMTTRERTRRRVPVFASVIPF